MQTTYDAAWYIVYTKRQSEKKVTQYLAKKKITHYCPMNRMRKQYLNRITITHQPLFPSYVFVHANPGSLNLVTRISGVLSLVHRLKDPVTISTEEILGIKAFLERYDNVATEKLPVSFTQLLTASEGQVIKQEGVNYFVNLQLPSLGSVLKASINLESVKPVDILFLPDEYPAFTTKVAN